ncbi:MAG: ABC transporter substrate-binding protein [Beijerinckiaceae bacterium]
MSTKPRKYPWLGRIVMSGVVLSAVTLAISAHADDNIMRIGIITDMSGQYSDGNGPGSVAAAQMAVDDFGGTLLGKRIEVISGDHQNKPDIGAGIVREWIDNRNVDVIAEGVNSAVALAIQNITRARKKAFLISGSGSSVLTGAECSPTSVQWTYDTYASANTTVKAMVERGYKTWFFLTADYAFGKALEKDATRAVIAAGGKVLGGVSHPFNTQDFSSYLLTAQDSGAQVLALANAGADLRKTIAQVDEFQLRKSGMEVTALQVTLTDVPAMGLKVAQGLIFTDSFYWDLNDETRAFANRFYAIRHAMPTSYQAGVYSAISHYLKSAKAANSSDPTIVVNEMRKLPVNDFFTKNGKVREDGRMVHDMYLMRIKKPEDSKGDWDVYEHIATVPGDQAFRPLSEGHCPYLGN